MQCPVCRNVSLMMTERQGVEIDYCPQCRGVWLDRGELDKIIERSAPVPHTRYDREEKYSPKEERHYEKSHYAHPKKKESFLGELFDF